MKTRLSPWMLVALVCVPSAATAQMTEIMQILSRINVANVNLQVSCLARSGALTGPDGKRCGLVGYGLELGVQLNPDTAQWIADFAIGYGQIHGFRWSDPAHDFRGIMRLSPEISFYLTRNTGGSVLPYVGVHSGAVSVSNWRVYSAPRDSIFTFSASALQLGATFGVSLPYNFYADVGYRYRIFPSLDWQLQMLRPGLPKSLSMSVFQGTVGAAFGLSRLTGRTR